jgi:hypothetical protein
MLLLLLFVLLPFSWLFCLGDVVPRARSLAALAHDSSLLCVTQQLAGPIPDIIPPISIGHHDITELRSLLHL